MLNWLKSLIGLTDVQNRVGLSETEVKLLKKDFSKLDKKASRISDRILHYLLDDEDEAVLQTIRKIPQAGSTLGLQCNGYSFAFSERNPPRAKFFASTTCQDAAFWYRLARIYDAASQTEPRQLWCYGLRQGLEWLEVFLREIVQYQMNVWPRKLIKPNIEIATLESMLVAADAPADALVRGALLVDVTHYGYTWNKEIFLAIPELAESFVRHPASVVEALHQSHHKARVYALEMLSAHNTPLMPFVEIITELAVGSSKTVRKAAEPLLSSDPETAQPALKQKAEEGNNQERLHAVKLLWKINGEACREFLQNRAQQERSKKVKQAVEQMFTFENTPVQPLETSTQSIETSSDAPAPPLTSFDLPPVEPVAPDAPLPLETKQALHEAVKACNDQAMQYWERLPKQYRFRRPPTISFSKVEKAFDALQHLVVSKPSKFKQAYLKPTYYDDKSLRLLLDFAFRPEIQLIHVIRLLVMMEMIRLGGGHGYAILPWGEQMFDTYRKERLPSLSLRKLAAVFSAIGLDEHLIAENVLWRSRWQSGGIEWGDEAIWQFFAERLHLLEEAFGLRPSREENIYGYWQSEIRKNAFRVLQTFPFVPEQFVPMLWEIALGTGKSERYDAQACLRHYPEKEIRIMAALADGKKDVRTAAAEWLGGLNCQEAIPAIKKALEKEKHEEPKGIMMQALEQLGVPMEQFVNRKRLAEEAKKGLKKGIPAKLQWFPFDNLPIVHWEKTRAKVDSDILRWFLVQSFKFKNPEPGPLLRLYCSYFRQAEREAFGKYVLEHWLAEDTKPKYTHEEARELAEKELQQTRRYVRQYPQYYANWDEEKHFNAVLHNLLITCLGSAIPGKGILAVAGACAGADIVAVVDRFLKDWYGKRAAQCKALVQMLAWIDEPLAIQLLLSVGNRFRTKSIQQEAAKQVQLLAERKGWSMDELADRTIPTAGLDNTGTLELDYGLRKFCATLSEDLTLILTNEEDKQIKSLPAARKSEDPDMVKQAKKQFSAAKKELKSVLKMQKERLYEAMCTQRSWHAEDWDMYLNQHPIVGRYCQRLVWVAYHGENPVCSFRPLPDRSLSDYEDEEVTLESHATIRLAHDCTISEENRQSWLEHLSDYEVVPLFPQFGRTPFTLSEDQKKETELSDFLGHLLSAFALRGRAVKLGYVRGEAEDAGWFYTYKKFFPSLGLQAIIEFTGNFLPEEDRTVALQHLSFYRQPKERDSSYAHYGNKIPLGRIPPVLLVECWNDMRTIAAEGPGYDPEWEKKTAY